MKKIKLEREEGVTYIATISGGRDSTAMCDLLLKNGFPVDYILFYDTLLEHKEMYLYVEKLKVYFEEHYKKKITVLKPKKEDFKKDYMFKKRVKGEFKGYLHGFLSPNVGFCHWRTYSKIEVEKKFVKDNKIKNPKVYIGFTKDESKRIKKRNEKFLYPLIDNFKMTAVDCLEYLIKQDLENPLYRHFTRTGCSICPFQSEKHWFKIWKFYPEIWQTIKDMEIELQNYKKVVNPLAFGKISIFEKEKQFEKADKEGVFDEKS